MDTKTLTKSWRGLSDQAAATPAAWAKVKSFRNIIGKNQGSKGEREAHHAKYCGHLTFDAFNWEDQWVQNMKNSTQVFMELDQTYYHFGSAFSFSDRFICVAETIPSHTVNIISCHKELLVRKLMAIIDLSPLQKGLRQTTIVYI